MENNIKQNEVNTSLLIDCYSILYRIQFVMKIIGETDEEILEYKQKVKNIESKLLDGSNKPDSNYNQLLLELKTIEEVLNCIYQKRLKEHRLPYEYYSKVLEKYDDACIRIEKNNNVISRKITDLKFGNRFKRSYLLGIGDTLVFSIISLMSTFFLPGLPIYSREKTTYNSQTKEYNVEEEKNTTIPKDMVLLDLYGKLINGERKAVEIGHQYKTLDEAIAAGNELLNAIYGQDEIGTNEDDLYYEVIYLNYTDTYKAATGIFLSIIFYILGFVFNYIAYLKGEKVDNLLITRIYENIKTGIVFKKDFKKLMNDIIEFKECNEDIANEFYSAIVDGINNSDFDEMKEHIELLKSKMNEHEEAAKAITLW